MNVGNLDAHGAKSARNLLGQAEHRAVFAHVGQRSRVAGCLALRAPGATRAKEGRRADAA